MARIEVDSGTGDAGILYDALFTKTGYIELEVGPYTSFFENGVRAVHKITGGVRLDENGGGYYFELEWSVSGEYADARIYKYTAGDLFSVTLALTESFYYTVRENAKYRFLITEDAPNPGDVTLNIFEDRNGIDDYISILQAIESPDTIPDPGRASVIISAYGGGSRSKTSVNYVEIYSLIEESGPGVIVTENNTVLPDTGTLTLSGPASEIFIPEPGEVVFIATPEPGSLVLQRFKDLNFYDPKVLVSRITVDGAKTRLERLSVDYTFERIRRR